MAVNLTETTGERVREKSDKTFILKIGDPQNNNQLIKRSDINTAFLTITNEADGAVIRARADCADLFDETGVFTLKLTPTDNTIQSTLATTKYETHIITIELEVLAAGGNRKWNEEFLYEVINLRNVN